jgi:hypothetical protein
MKYCTASLHEQPSDKFSSVPNWSSMTPILHEVQVEWSSFLTRGSSSEDGYTARNSNLNNVNLEYFKTVNIYAMKHKSNHF